MNGSYHASEPSPVGPLDQKGKKALLHPAAITRVEGVGDTQPTLLVARFEEEEPEKADAEQTAAVQLRRASETPRNRSTTPPYIGCLTRR